jgi:hypothetical protein
MDKMDNWRIDGVIRTLASGPSRRGVLHGLIGSGLALGAARPQSAANPRAKRKKKRRDERKDNDKKRRAISCAESCSSVYKICLVRPEGRPLCAPLSLGGTNCLHCATDQDCLDTPETPYCITELTERTTGETIPLDGLCPEMTVGVCTRIDV